MAGEAVGGRMTVQDRVKPSIGRRLVWLYVDFLIAAAAITLVAHVLGEALTPAVDILAPALVGGALQFFSWSPGRSALRIGADGLVDRRVVDGTSRIVTALAVLFVLEGAKRAVRWTGLSAWPFFGWTPEGAAAAVIGLVHGALYVACGFLLFRHSRAGYRAAMALVAAELVSLALGWSVLGQTLAARTIERRAGMGRVPDAAEIAYIQAVVPTGILLFGLVVILLLYQRRRAFA